jgi:tetratricopeptide (TPR) repeat protein
MCEGPEQGLRLIDDLLAREQLSHYHLAHSARADLCRRLGRIPEARASYEKALALAQQEPERRFLARRLEELKKSPSRMSILSVPDDYRMNDPRLCCGLENLYRRKHGAIFGRYHLPDNYDPSKEDESMVRDINTLNEEVDAAGAGMFAGGLEPASKAKTVQKQPDGEVVITDGPLP